MSSIKELSKQLVALNGAANKMEACVGWFLSKWFCSSPWAQHQPKVCLAELGPQVHTNTCKAAMAHFKEERERCDGFPKGSCNSQMNEAQQA